MGRHEITGLKDIGYFCDTVLLVRKHIHNLSLTHTHLDHLILVPCQRAVRLGGDATAERRQELPESHEGHGRQRE